jgi:putative transposase
LARLTKVVAVESAVDEKRDIHLSIHGKHDPAGRNRGNSRNGARSKTLLTEPGPVEIEVPLHRKSSVEPRIVTKRQWWLSGVDDLVISLSARYSQCGLRPQKLK